MAWRALQSHNLLARDYDPEEQMLHIQFSNGAVYAYARVPQTVVDSLDQSSSPKGYFDSKIKGVYAYRKISEGATPGGRRSTRRY